MTHLLVSYSMKKYFILLFVFLIEKSYFVIAFHCWKTTAFSEILMVLFVLTFSNTMSSCPVSVTCLCSVGFGKGVLLANGLRRGDGFQLP